MVVDHALANRHVGILLAPAGHSFGKPCLRRDGSGGDLVYKHPTQCGQVAMTTEDCMQIDVVAARVVEREAEHRLGVLRAIDSDDHPSTLGYFAGRTACDHNRAGSASH